MLRHAKPGKTSGVTLIELIIAIAILAILVMVGLPSFTEWILNSRIRNTAESVYLGLSTARAEAVKQDALVSFRMTGANGTWVVETGCNPVGQACATNITSRNTAEDPGQSVVVAEDQGAGINYTFNNLGRLIAPAADARLDVDNTAMNPAVSRNLRITVTVGGIVELCDPNVAVGDLRVCRF